MSCPSDRRADQQADRHADQEAKQRYEQHLEPPSRLVAPLLHTGVVVAALASGAGTLTTGRASRVAGGIAVATIVAVPLARVTLLVLRWARLRDFRFAAIGAALLMIVAAGALIAAAG